MPNGPDVHVDWSAHSLLLENLHGKPNYNQEVVWEHEIRTKERNWMSFVASMGTWGERHICVNGQKTTLPLDRAGDIMTNVCSLAPHFSTPCRPPPFCSHILSSAVNAID